jgi:hypothetical protein
MALIPAFHVTGVFMGLKIEKYAQDSVSTVRVHVRCLCCVCPGRIPEEWGTNSTTNQPAAWADTLTEV